MGSGLIFILIVNLNKFIIFFFAFYFKGSLPGVFVNYELSPIMVKFIEKSKPFNHFLTGCCAIIGGFFTIAGMLDSFTYRYYNMYKKFQINKLT
jgi:hypothetical protein